jgi:UPF0716 protein FxsA
MLWPLIEIGLFVTLGGALGLGMTLLIVLGTGVWGVWLLRGQGLRTTQRLRQEMGAIGTLGVVGDSAFMLLAGVLLVLPGFLTDILGVLLLLPPVRMLLVAALARRFGAASMRSDHPVRRADGIVIDGDFVEVEPDPHRPPSGWTKTQIRPRRDSDGF